MRPDDNRDATKYQNADGQAHIAYFDDTEQLSFVWDGRSANAQVCPGGYGEPPRWHMHIPSRLRLHHTVDGLLVDFGWHCRRWIEDNSYLIHADRVIKEEEA